MTRTHLFIARGLADMGCAGDRLTLQDTAILARAYLHLYALHNSPPLPTTGGEAQPGPLAPTTAPSAAIIADRLSEYIAAMRTTGTIEAGGHHLGCCPNCSSGDMTWCNISVRPRCNECGYWGRVNHGSRSDAIAVLIRYQKSREVEPSNMLDGLAAAFDANDGNTTMGEI